MTKTVLLAALTLLLATTPAASRQSLSFATVHGQAYADTGLLEYGASSAIIAEACSRAGIDADFHFMPWKRAMNSVAQGRYDALHCAYYSRERAKTFALSEPYMRIQLMLCVKKRSPVAWDGTLKSLAPYRIGVVLGYVNTREFDNAEDLDKDVAPNERLNLSKLLEGRVDVIVTERQQALFLLDKDDLPGTRRDVKFLSPPLGEKDMYVMFSKAVPKWRTHLSLFNKGLSQIKTDGTRDAILRRFGFHVPNAMQSAPDVGGTDAP